VQNHGFASIGSLSESLGSQRFGTQYRYRAEAGRLDGDVLPVDLAANAASLGTHVLRASTVGEFRTAMTRARAHPTTTVVHVETAVAAAGKAFESWGNASLSQRTRIMFAFRELLVKYETDLAKIISAEHGKVIDDARGEIVRGREVVEYACGIADALKGGFSD